MNYDLQTGSFIIGTKQPNGTLSFSSNPAVHRTLHVARKEAERLSRNNPGVQFVLMKCEGIAHVPVQNPVQWK